MYGCYKPSRSRGTNTTRLMVYTPTLIPLPPPQVFPSQSMQPSLHPHSASRILAGTIPTGAGSKLQRRVLMATTWQTLNMDGEDCKLEVKHYNAWLRQQFQRHTFCGKMPQLESLDGRCFCLLKCNILCLQLTYQVSYMYILLHLCTLIRMKGRFST